MEKNNSAQKIGTDTKVSEILQDFISSVNTPTVTLGEFKKAISYRSYGLLMFMFSLPCVLPIPTPGLSAIVGLPLLILSFQLMIGFKSPWFPKFISEKKFKFAEMKKVINYMIPYLKKLEVVMEPRLEFLVKPPAERIIAILCFLLSILIILPIPFGNALPAMAICLFSLAILTHDGVIVIFALIITALSTLLVSAAAGGISSLLG